MYIESKYLVRLAHTLSQAPLYTYWIHLTIIVLIYISEWLQQNGLLELHTVAH